MASAIDSGDTIVAPWRSMCSFHCGRNIAVSTGAPGITPFTRMFFSASTAPIACVQLFTAAFDSA